VIWFLLFADGTYVKTDLAGSFVPQKIGGNVTVYFLAASSVTMNISIVFDYEFQYTTVTVMSSLHLPTAVIHHIFCVVPAL